MVITQSKPIAMKRNLLSPSVHHFILLFGFTIVLLLNWTCQKGDDDDPIPPPPDNLIAEDTIGPEGGILSSEEVILDIPAGAFQSASVIHILRLSSNPPDPANSLSPSYEIKGLPLGFTSSLTLKIKTDDALHGDGFITVKKQALAPSGNANQTIHEPFLAELEDGFLVVTLNSENVMAAVSSSVILPRVDLSLLVNTITGYYSDRRNDFEFVYPFSTLTIPDEKQGVKNIENALVQAKAELSSTYKFNIAKRTKWPMKVIIQPLTKEDDNGEPINGEAVLPYWSTGTLEEVNSGLIYMNFNLLKNKQAMQTTATHEFLHLVQYLYTTNQQYNWMREAYSVWYECQYATTPSEYKPEVWNAKEYKRSLLNGLHAGSLGSSITPSQHGYGAFPVIRYLENQYGPLVGSFIWAECANGREPLEAIALHTDPTLSWWNDFMEKYYTDEIIPDAKLDVLLENENDLTVELKNVTEDTTFSFADRYMYDLSGIVYKVLVPTTGYTPEHKLEITASPSSGSKIYVYKRGIGQTKDLLGEGFGLVTIEDWVSVAKGGVIYILVSNGQYDPSNPLHKTKVTVEGKITKKVSVPGYKKCWIDFQVTGEIRTYHTATGYVSFSSGTIGHSSSSSGNGPMTGSMTGYVFTGSNAKETITVTFSPDGKKIENVQWVGDEVTNYSAACSVSANNIPSDNNTPWNWWYHVDGLNTCDLISQFTFSDSLPEETISLVSYSCDAYRYLHIIIE